MSKHTAGPWSENLRDSMPAVGIDVHDGLPMLPIVSTVHGRNKKEAMANRRLIAAAPELLEALASLLDMDVAYKRGPVVEEAVEVAHAAIFKATGEQA